MASVLPLVLWVVVLAMALWSSFSMASAEADRGKARQRYDFRQWRDVQGSVITSFALESSHTS